MVDRTSPPSQDEIDQVMAGYGLGSNGQVAPTVVAPEDSADVLKGYGVTLKGGAATQFPSPPSYEQTFKDDIAARKAYESQQFRPGKIPTAPEPLPTRAEFKSGEKRGLGAQFVGGIPIAGPALNLFTAATAPNVPGEPATFGQRFYDQSQADRAYAMAHPWSSFGANLAGNMIGYGGIAKAFPSLLGLTGPTLATRIYQGVGGGGGLNALDATLRGENPLTAAEVGAGGGVLGPIMGEGARSFTNAAASNFWPRPGPLIGVPRQGISLLSNALSGETPASLAAARARMGPSGFLADINPQTTDLAGAISDMPIAERAMIQDAYRTRAAGQRGRIEDALTQATGIGPDVNVVDLKNFWTESRKAAADPIYQQWRSMQVHPTDALKDMIPRLEKVGAFDEAEYLSGATGTPINRNFFTGGPQKAYPTTETWDLVKRGLDSKIEQAYSAGNNTRARALVGLKGELLAEIEKTPAGQVWKQARSEFADRSALIDQLAAGRDTFLGSRAGLSADELREELGQLSGPELAARMIGMRKAVAEAMGDTTEGAGRMREKLLAPNNQDKMRLMLAGNPGAADDLIATLESERHLARNLPAVIPNMSTGASGQTRTERGRLFAPAPAASWLPDVDLTHPLNMIPASMRAGNVLQDFANARAARVAPALAPILLTPQPQIGDLVNALSQEGRRMANVNSLVSRYVATPMHFAIAGPGQAEYRRHIEMQNPLALPSRGTIAASGP